MGKLNFSATPYTFTLYLEADALEDLQGAMDEDERLSLIQLAKEGTDKENAKLLARTDAQWREVVKRLSKPYGWWSWDKEKQEAWIDEEIARQKSQLPYPWQSFDLDEVEFALPAVDIACGRCDGAGTHVNPAIDGNGITQSEWNEWGWEERENYMDGVYDVRCHTCDGQCFEKRVVDACYLSEPQKRLLKLLEIKWRDDAEHERICESERRMGA